METNRRLNISDVYEWIKLNEKHQKEKLLILNGINQLNKSFETNELCVFEMLSFCSDFLDFCEINEVFKEQQVKWPPELISSYIRRFLFTLDFFSKTENIGKSSLKLLKQLFFFKFDLIKSKETKIEEQAVNLLFGKNPKNKSKGEIVKLHLTIKSIIFTEIGAYFEHVLINEVDLLCIEEVSILRNIKQVLVDINEQESRNGQTNESTEKQSKELEKLVCKKFKKYALNSFERFARGGFEMSLVEFYKQIIRSFLFYFQYESKNQIEQLFTVLFTEKLKKINVSTFNPDKLLQLIKNEFKIQLNALY